MKIYNWFLISGMVLLTGFTVGVGQRLMPISPALTQDSSVYINVAENIVNSGSLRMDMTLTTAHENSRHLCSYMPGYPIFLSLLLWVGIQEQAALYGLTLAGQVMMVLMMVWLVRGLTRNTIASLASGVFVLVFQPLLDSMTYALTETLFIPFSILAFCLLIRYLKDDHPRWYIVIGLVFAMASVSLLRLVGGFLVVAVGGVLVIRSIHNKKWTRAYSEASMTIFSQLPTLIVLLVNYMAVGRFYCATNSAGWNIDRTTRSWLAQLMLSEFKPDLSLGLGFRRLAANFPSLVIGIIIFAFLILLIFIIWKSRGTFSRVVKDLANWPIMAIVAYLVLYYGFFFIGGDNWARWDFPRYLVPGYPFIFALALTLGAILYRHFALWYGRAFLIMVLLAFSIAYSQSSLRMLPTIPLGRGLESGEVAGHPAMTYLKQNLRETDLLFSTREPTLWYYFRRPVRRIEGIEKISCHDLQTPPNNGRSIFVIFPEGNYQGDPASLENIQWFLSWISPCGTVIDQQILSDTAVYIVEHSRSD